jgi:Raf kinase inhibitor-like YbhB/YbcL family protein
VSAGPTRADTLALSSSAFESGGRLPSVYTHDGEDRSPPLSIGGVPAESETLALVVDDPDAGDEPFVHWLLWDVPADTRTNPPGVNQTRRVAALDGAAQGTNDFGELGYLGPRPPADDGPHTYRFTLSAVDGTLPVQAGSRRWAVSDALAEAELARARVVGRYER